MLTCLLEFGWIEQALQASSYGWKELGLESQFGKIVGVTKPTNYVGNMTRDNSAENSQAQANGSYGTLARGNSDHCHGPKTAKSKIERGKNSIMPAERSSRNAKAPQYSTIDHMAEDSIMQEQQSTELGDQSPRQKPFDDSKFSRKRNTVQNTSKAMHLTTNATLLSNGSKGSLPHPQAKISHRQHLMTRTQLFEMRRTLLEKCEELISQTQWPFVSSNLNPDKIFRDLVQFHSGAVPE